VIILKIQIQHVTVIEPEREAIVSSYRQGVLSFTIALQRVKPETGKVQIPKFL
jgi:hypothetical protein